MKITVCVASIGRNSLLDTLDSLSKCKLQQSVSFNVVVADDSSNKLVAMLLSEHIARWTFPIKIVNSSSNNISVARNLCMSNASGDFLAFIDDDEMADENWLYNFVDLINSSQADAAFGPVDAIYPVESKKWICLAEPFVKYVGKRGDEVATGSTCNAFVRKSIIESLNLSFRSELGRSGGEDTAFFTEISRGGGKLVASDDALVYERVPVERLTIAHLSKRYIRGGQTYASIFFSLRNPSFKIALYIAALAKVIVFFWIVIFLSLFRKDIALKYAFRLWLNLGKLRNLLNMRIINLYDESK